jgi:hypothetical protein
MPARVVLDQLALSSFSRVDTFFLKQSQEGWTLQDESSGQNPTACLPFIQ